MTPPPMMMICGSLDMQDLIRVWNGPYIERFSRNERGKGFAGKGDMPLVLRITPDIHYIAT
jgi:hypothetical protein